MKKKTILVTGGARSGKSDFASTLAGRYERVVFVATGQALDAEMAARIDRHKKSRPGAWHTIEEPLDIVSALKTVPAGTGVVIIDCLTLWVANMTLAQMAEAAVLRQVEALIQALRDSGFAAIVVTNEVGSGIVPENKLARDFRDIAGRANQMVARAVDEVFLMVAGLPLKVKGEE